MHAECGLHHCCASEELLVHLLLLLLLVLDISWSLLLQSLARLAPMRCTPVIPDSRSSSEGCA